MTNTAPDPDNPTEPATSDPSARRGAVWALANQLTTAVVAAVLTLFLVRALSPHEYGTFALAVAVVGLLDPIGSWHFVVCGSIHCPPSR